jgi:hypothetical protein
MVVSGIGRSLWEDLILESFFNIPSVSAARLLKLANQQGIPLYTIDKSNINLLLPQLQVSSEVIDDIKNAVNAGKKIIISKSNIQYNDWNGVGYIILDPVNGSGAYLISGGLAGGKFTKPLPYSHRELQVLYKRICEQKRWLILIFAGSLLGSPYRWGCKDPEAINPFKPEICKGVDCSGLVCYAYWHAGFGSVGCTQKNAKNAAMQFDAAKPTDNPMFVDLIFWKGTYDTNHDCFANENDGPSHVGMVLKYGWIIEASGRGVNVNKRGASRIESEEKAMSLLCNNRKDYVDAFKNNRCIGSDDCYNWNPTGKTFESFKGYRYAPEFDECPEE